MGVFSVRIHRTFPSSLLKERSTDTREALERKSSGMLSDNSLCAKDSSSRHDSCPMPCGSDPMNERDANFVT